MNIEDRTDANAPPRILFVDDDESVRIGFARVMQRAGFAVDLAASAAEAVALAESTTYPVIVTDLCMPELDGMGLIRSLRVRQPLATYLLVTGCAEVEPPVDRATDEAITAIISKPWDPDELVTSIRDAVELHRRRKAHAAERTPTVLIVEDDPHSGQSLRDYLDAKGFETVWARDGLEAIAAFQKRRVDLVLLDIMMPGADGYEVCRRIRSDSCDRCVPVIFVSAKGRPEDVELGFETEADGYVTKPYNLAALKAEVDVRLRVKRRHDALARQKRDLEELSSIDALTGLPGRRVFQERLEYELRRARRYRRPVSLLVIDVDHFKRVNDTKGHLFGDHVLKEVGALIQSTVREIDAPARYGGDEFVVVLPETDASGARILAERLRTSAQQHTFEARAQDPEADAEGLPEKARITLTIGAATSEGGRHPACLKEFVQWADQALYDAKTQGRNRVASFECHDECRHPRSERAPTAT